MDITEFKTIKDREENFINIERSSFITTIAPVDNVQQAREFIAEISKKYADATHNCPAYRVLEGNKIVEFASDNGEPSGTAGLPMLNVLKSAFLLNVAVVVTRYFGGKKLGVRGLIDAYSQSVKEVLEKVTIITKRRAYKQKVKVSYDNYSKKLGELNYLKAKVLDIIYENNYSCIVFVYDKILDDSFDVEIIWEG